MGEMPPSCFLQVPFPSNSCLEGFLKGRQDTDHNTTLYRAALQSRSIGHTLPCKILLNLYCTAFPKLVTILCQGYSLPFKPGSAAARKRMYSRVVRAPSGRAACGWCLPPLVPLVCEVARAESCSCTAACTCNAAQSVCSICFTHINYFRQRLLQVLIHLTRNALRFLNSWREQFNAHSNASKASVNDALDHTAYLRRSFL